MKQSILATALLAAFVLPTQAAVINDTSALLGPTSVVDFEAFEGFITAGPETVAPGVTFTGSLTSELGAYIRDLGDNGVWGLGNHFAATGTDNLLTFTFDNLQSGVGAFVNHFRDSGGGSVTVTAYDGNQAVLETYSLLVNTAIEGYNEGAFLGISRGTADIKSVTISGLGVVADNLSYTATAAVPEPETYALALIGLGLLGAIARRRQQG